MMPESTDTDASGAVVLDAFISYSSRDADMANLICDRLEAAGIRCWIAPRNITPGQNWSECIIDGLNACRLLVLVFTHDSNTSPQCQREVERAVHKGMALMPFRIEDVPLSKPMEYFISAAHWLSPLTRDPEALSPYFTDLISAANALLGRGSTNTARTNAVTPPKTFAASVEMPAPTATPHNLPHAANSFIGRDHELAEVIAHLENTRLLTLVGPGGSGKTRLATEAARTLLAPGENASAVAFPDGIFLVEFAPTTGDNLDAAVAEALGVTEEPGRSLLQSVQEHLQTHRALLILDNCEHVVAEAARLADALLKRCPGVYLLATSREGLNIPGETLYRVPTLSLPESGMRLTPDRLLDYGATRLFIERARSAKPGFTITPAEAEIVVRLCRRLDGIPLALELAAARVRAMSVEQIDQRLDSRFRLLTGGSRTALPRQQTLRALIDWSYDLLSPAEQTLLRRLAVFAGGWDLEAAENVCALNPQEGFPEEATGGVPPAPLESWEILDLLLQLVDKSLVIHEPSEDGNDRYHLLETLREYSRERMDELQEAAWFLAHHRNFFVARAAAVMASGTGPEQIAWIRRDIDNFRAALASSLQENTMAAGQDALRITQALTWFWEIRGHFHEGRQRCQQALEREQASDSVLSIGVRIGAGRFAWLQGDYDAAEAHYTEALRLYEQCGDEAGRLLALSHLGDVSYARGDLDRAFSLQQQALHLCQESGNEERVGHLLVALGNIQRTRMEYESAESYYTSALDSARSHEDMRLQSIALNNLGAIAADQDQFKVARAFYEQSIGLRRTLGDQRGLAIALSNLAEVASAQGDMRAARNWYEESLGLFFEMGDRHCAALTLAGMASLAAEQERWRHVARLCAASEGMRNGIGAPLAPSERAAFDQLIASARGALGREAFEIAWNEGRATAPEKLSLQGD